MTTMSVVKHVTKTRILKWLFYSITMVALTYTFLAYAVYANYLSIIHDKISNAPELCKKPNKAMYEIIKKASRSNNKLLYGEIYDIYPPQYIMREYGNNQRSTLYNHFAGIAWYGYYNIYYSADEKYALLCQVQYYNGASGLNAISQKVFNKPLASIRVKDYAYLIVLTIAPHMYKDNLMMAQNRAESLYENNNMAEELLSSQKLYD